VLGCYERSIIGFEITSEDANSTIGDDLDVDVEENKNDPSAADDLNNCNKDLDIPQLGLKLNHNFGYVTHLGAVRVVAANGKTFVSGSEDETMKIYNLSKLKEVASVYVGSEVNAVAFFGKQLLCGTAAGRIHVYHISPIVLVKQYLAHKGGVRDIAVHPTGKLSLTIGEDKQIQLWNLHKHQSVYKKQFDELSTCVRFGVGGKVYGVTHGKKLSLYNTANGKMMHEVTHSNVLLAVSFINDEFVAAGGEGGSIGIWSVNDGKQLLTIQENARVKALSILPDAANQISDLPYLVSAHSDGHLCIWDVREGALVTKKETGARLTSLSITTLQRKHQQEEKDTKTEQQLQEEDSEEDYKETKEELARKVKVIVEYEQDDEIARQEIKVEKEDEDNQPRAKSSQFNNREVDKQKKVGLYQEDSETTELNNENQEEITQNQKSEARGKRKIPPSKHTARKRARLLPLSRVNSVGLWKRKSKSAFRKG